jgi:hypothetical protein
MASLNKLDWMNTVFSLRGLLIIIATKAMTAT